MLSSITGSITQHSVLGGVFPQANKRVAQRIEGQLKDLMILMSRVQISLWDVDQSV
jgi:predicted regulator of Ras-like GTPase activity (Roadblock/LC7/MglB family)